MMKQKGREEEVELAKERCKGVIDRIERLGVSQSCRRTLLRLALSDLNFLTRSSSTSSLNIGHLEAIVHILQQPFITGVSRVCKPISSPLHHLDIVCTLNTNPVWIIVSDRNPTYISWDSSPKKKTKGLKFRLQQLLTLARSSTTLKPSSIILFFSNGLHCNTFIREKLREEFGASEIELDFSVFDFDYYFSDDSDGEWVNVNVLGRSYRGACVLEIKVVGGGDDDDDDDISVLSAVKGSTTVASVVPKLSELAADTFCSLISGLKIFPSQLKTKLEMRGLLAEGDLVNFDTTALIALVSGISNGCTQKLLATPESELRQRFKGNYTFVIGQVMSEIQNPIHVELGSIISGKLGIICESVHSEFKQLVLMCGGPNEKFRADQLLKHLTVVADSPSQRVMGLPTTRKLALKNKVVFGTGDYWHAPTVTANMAFVRAISQTGMSLFTIEHRPRALTGD
ncbi:hypothetical protein RGQ29_003250 [Quercus rubra]|uniref:DUF1308 domain-containing protein n=2 Tax=Quercus rubra TaxID=3512 RepID=A0AAN7EB53_QUERU|nr:hypothetical protein RGQ29_003250 [Quercus rubra]KAK4567365.1 hypothetical protein RGQ29_003250 [Quercus rubra]KAK4567366.1 hypothetical protein RGQ29_003250 [Quercus rubra]